MFCFFCFASESAVACRLGLEDEKKPYFVFRELTSLFSGTCFSPSSANIENLDMKEMYYNKSQKDLTEEKIHHLLSENLFMPRNRVIFWIDFDFKANLHIQLKLFGIK